MLVEIIGVEVTDEQGLGPCYRVAQRTEQGIELYLLPRSAVAADLELYDIDDPLLVLDWRLHGYRGDPLPPGFIEASLHVAAQAQQAQAFAVYARAGLAEPAARSAVADVDRTRIEHEIGQAEADVGALKAEARQLRAEEIADIRQTVTIVDGRGLAALRALVTADIEEIEVDRQQFREQMTPSLYAENTGA